MCVSIPPLAGLGEVVEAAGRTMISDFLPLVLPAVRDALCDPDAGVRQAAQTSFTILQKTVGKAALGMAAPHTHTLGWITCA